jgi:hypothetical protein
MHGTQQKACIDLQAILLTCQGSNLDSSDPESDVLPVTPQVSGTPYPFIQAGVRLRHPAERMAMQVMLMPA